MLFARLAREREAAKVAMSATAMAVGTQVGFSGKQNVLRSFVRKVTRGASGGDGKDMRTLRDRVKDMVGRVGTGRRRKRE